MSISFNTIPATIRTGGQFIEYSNAQATSGLTAAMVNNNLLIGLARSGGAAGTVAANVLANIASPADAAAKWGHGSVLAHMAEMWFAVNPYLPLSGIGIAPDGAGTAAAGAFVFTGTATVGGTLNAYIAGEQISVAITVNETAAQVATALYTAVVAYCLATNLPVVASNGTPGTTTITALEKGLYGNQIDLRINYQQGDILPAGLACSITAMGVGVLGAGAHVLTTAIAAMGNTWFTTIVMDDNLAANVLALEAAMLTAWGPMVMQDGQVYYGVIGNKAAQEAVAGATRNSPFSTCMGGGLSPTPPWTWAVQAAACDATQPDAGRPRSQLLLPNCLPPAAGLGFVWSDRNIMLGEGISTYTIVSGQCYIERLVTTYQLAPSGVSDISYMSIETMRTLAYLRYTWRLWIALKFPRYKLAADGTNFDPSQPIVTPKRITSEAIAWFQSMIDQGLAFNKAAFVAAIAGQVQINPSDPDRVDMVLTPQCIRQFRTLAAQIQFLL